MLNSKQILCLLDLIREKYGLGYASEPGMAKLQAKLSIMLEVAQRNEAMYNETVEDVIPKQKAKTDGWCKS